MENVIAEIIKAIKEGIDNFWFGLIMLLGGGTPLVFKDVANMIHLSVLQQKWPYTSLLFMIIAVAGLVVVLRHFVLVLNSKLIQPLYKGYLAQAERKRDEAEIAKTKEWLPKNEDWQDWMLIEEIVKGPKQTARIYGAENERSLQRLLETRVIKRVYDYSDYYTIRDEMWEVLNPIMEQKFEWLQQLRNDAEREARMRHANGMW